jgi:hypothetical protein
MAAEGDYKRECWKRSAASGEYPRGNAVTCTASAHPIRRKAANLAGLVGREQPAKRGGCSN